MAPAVEDTLRLVGRIDKGSPEQLAESVPAALTTFADAETLAPAEVQADLAELALHLGIVEEALVEADWDISTADITREDFSEIPRIAIRISEYDGDTCAIDNGYGTWMRADELAGVEPIPSDPAMEVALVDVGFTQAEAACMTQAVAYLDEVESLFSVYGFCGIASERLFELLTSG